MYRDYTPITVFSIIPHDSYLRNVHVGLSVINNLEIEVLERVQIGDKLRQWQLIESCVVLDLGMWGMTGSNPLQTLMDAFDRREHVN